MIEVVAFLRDSEQLLATGISAVQLGDFGTAGRAANRLGELAAQAAAQDNDTSYYSRNSKPLQIMYMEVAGLLAIAQGDSPAGLLKLQEAVAVAESMRPPNGAPNPLKPPHELYAEALLGSDKPADVVIVTRRGAGACGARQRRRSDDQVSPAGSRVARSRRACLAGSHAVLVDSRKVTVGK